MSEINYKDELYTGDNGLELCQICGRRIPKEMERISFSYRNRYGHNYKRVCGYCIIRLSECIDKEAVRKGVDKWMIKEL